MRKLQTAAISGHATERGLLRIEISPSNQALPFGGYQWPGRSAQPDPRRRFAAAENVRPCSAWGPTTATDANRDLDHRISKYYTERPLGGP